MAYWFLGQLLVVYLLCSVCISKTCPKTSSDCICSFINDLMDITCTFQDGIITEPIINATEENNTTRSIDILNLESNNLTSIPPTVFSNILSIGTLNLQNNMFSVIPETIKEVNHVSLLDISRNIIKELNFSEIQSMTVSSINCAYNYIENIILKDDEKSLLYLNISHNNLRVVPDKLWTISEILDLTNNKIDILRKLPKSKVRYVYLTNNKLTAIEGLTFENVQDLNELHLDGNAISELSVEAFNGLSMLTELFLSRNELTSLENGLFADLNFLVTLSLSDNKLESLHSEVFSGLETMLQQLVLRNNQLYELPNDTFVSLEKLRRLDLSFNSGITDINYIMFPSHVASLEVNNCSLTEIRNCIFLKLTDLQNLDLSGNNFKCSCHLSLLYGWYKDRTVHGYSSRPSNHNTWTCHFEDATSLVQENIEVCGRYQDIEPDCGSHVLLVIDNSPVKINMTMITSDNLITITWDVHGNMTNVHGYRVTYKSNGNIMFESPVLDKFQNSFVISYVTQKDEYEVCVDILGRNATFILTSDCQSVSSLSLDYLIGILSGVLLLIPCIAALLFILHKDKLVRRAEYSRLADNSIKNKSPPDAHTVVAVVDEVSVIIETAVCPFHENKAFAGESNKQLQYEIEARTDNNTLAPNDDSNTPEPNITCSAVTVEDSASENTKL